MIKQQLIRAFALTLVLLFGAASLAYACTWATDEFGTPEYKRQMAEEFYKVLQLKPYPEKTTQTPAPAASSEKPAAKEEPTHSAGFFRYASGGGIHCKEEEPYGKFTNPHPEWWSKDDAANAKAPATNSDKKDSTDKKSGEPAQTTGKSSDQPATAEPEKTTK